MHHIDNKISSFQTEFRAGIRDTLPLLVGVAVFGLAYGLFAQQAKLSFAETLAMSVFVFAGASQFVAVSMFSIGTPGSLIILSTLFINLRHLLMGLSLSRYLRDEKPWKQALLAHIVIDETYALAAARWANHPTNKAYLIGSGGLMFIMWQLSSAAGVLIGPALGNPLNLGLDFALPATFIGLLVPQLRDKATRVAALVAGVVAVVGATILPNNWHMILAALVAMLVGVALETRK